MYNGDENINLNGNSIQHNVLDYWQWAHNNLADTFERGIFAEYLVYTAISDRAGIRYDGPYDLVGCNGLKIEVKSAAVKHGTGKQGQDTRNTFSIAPVQVWNEWAYSFSREKVRPSDIYVFAVWLTADDRFSIIDSDNWEFYVMSTPCVNETFGADSKSVSLSRIRSLREPCKYADLKLNVYKEYYEHSGLTFIDNPNRDEDLLDDSNNKNATEGD